LDVAPSNRPSRGSGSNRIAQHNQAVRLLDAIEIGQHESIVLLDPDASLRQSDKDKFPTNMLEE
jgi:hypothetical protein